MKPMATIQKPAPVLLAALCLAAVFLLPACGDKKNKYQAPPPPKVTVAKPMVKDITDYADFTGTTQAVESVDVRARVQGFLESIHFEPASYVKKGDLLFVIDPKPYQAKLDQALASVASAKADLQLAQATLKRKERAYKQRAISEVEVIQAKADKAKALASIQGAEADVEQTRIDLGYTKVYAPIGGKISRNLVDIGNLVGSGEATKLTSIKRDDPVYAYFSVSTRTLLMYRDRRKKSKRDAPPDSPEVFLGLANEKGYPHQGVIDYADNTVDPATGTLQLRGVFPNRKKLMVPGMFVRIRIPFETIKNALLVTERALSTDQGGHYLLVVNGKNEVEHRQVELGALQNGMRVIKNGLKADEWVVIKGLQLARPGAKVTPVQEKDQKPKQPAEAKPADKQTKK